MTRLGYVLAGGRSIRMGADKARLPCRGVPMAVAVAEALSGAGLAATLVRRSPPDGLPWVDRDGRAMRVLWESDGLPRHPLVGLVEALADAQSQGWEHVLVLPCDLPGLGPEHLVPLLAVGGPCVAQDVDGRRNPLVAVVPCSLLGAARQIAQTGGSAMRLVEDFPVVPLTAGALRNANCPEDRPASPTRALMARLPTGIDAHRLLDGERQRQRARGIVDPALEGVSWPAEEER